MNASRLFRLSALIQTVSITAVFAAFPIMGSAGVAAAPTTYWVTPNNPSIETTCAHLSLFVQFVCLATAQQPVQLTVPSGAAACPDSGPGASCGVSNAMKPDAGAVSTPVGMGACPIPSDVDLPQSPAACQGPLPGQAGPIAVVPSIPAASLSAPRHVRLIADAATEVPGGTDVLTATSDAPLQGTGSAVEIFDTSTGRLVGACAIGTTCTVAYAAHAGMHTFVAYITAPTDKVLSGGAYVSSNAVTVSWIGVTMVSDRTAIGPGKPITLTATSTIAIEKTGWLLQIYDAPTHTRLSYCASGNTCRVTMTQATAGGRGLVAVLAPQSEKAPSAEHVVAQTDVVQLTWLSVAVVATANSSQPGGVVHVVASVNGDLTDTGWKIAILDNNGHVAAPMCTSGSSCSADVTITGAMPSFSAAVGTTASIQGKNGQLLGKSGDGLSLVNIQATSKLVAPIVHSSKILWGVDSCSSLTSGIYPQVVNQLGSPDFWGRYLTNTVCPGINGDEVSSARYYHMGILPIYNDYNCSDVVGYDTGRQYGAAAVAAAQAIGIPRGVALAIDIEPPGDACPGAANVDGGFVEGWYDGVMSANYVPAYYGNAGPGMEFANAYCAAVTARPEIANNSHIWTFQASLWGPYSKSNRPDWGFAYNTHCPENGTAWQYMLSAGSSPDVDQDLVISDFPLWYP